MLLVPEGFKQRSDETDSSEKINLKVKQLKEEVMKKYLVVLAAIMMVIFMVSGVYAAGTATPTVAATATIANVCSASNDGKIDFGTIDEVANAGGATGTITPSTIHCTAGSTYVVTAAGANNGGSGTGPYYLGVGGVAPWIAYSITFNTPITGKGTTTSIGGTGAGNLALTGSIASGALTTQPAGAYTDTITLTIAY